MSVSVNQFLRGVGESGLLPETVAAAFRGTLPNDVKNDTKLLARAMVDAGKLTKYQAAAIYQGRPQGLVLGNYVVLDKLGAGGMGQVFKARHTRMDRIVALKVLSRKQTVSPDAVKRFHREVRAAARLNHPNIVTAHDADEFEGQHYLVMEYVDGQDLASLVTERGPLPVNEALDYVIQAGKGLQYAHEQGIIHRDIKPGNILLDRDGTAKVLDMGLAHNRFGEHADDEATATEDLTETGQIMGTVNYMAPEQAVDTRSADARADIYSLGCTLYRLLTGEVPYRADTTMKILLAHRENPIPSLRAERPEVSAALDIAFQKMMAKHPDQRYQTMAEAVADLEKLFAGEVKLAPPLVPTVLKRPPPMPPAAADAALSRAAVPPKPPAPPVAMPPIATTLQVTAMATPTRPMPAPARPRADQPRETINIQINDDTNPHVFQRRDLGRPRRWLLMPLVIGGGAIVLLLLLALALGLLGGQEHARLDSGEASVGAGSTAAHEAMANIDALIESGFDPKADPLDLAKKLADEIPHVATYGADLAAQADRAKERNLNFGGLTFLEVEPHALYHVIYKGRPLAPTAKRAEEIPEVWRKAAIFATMLAHLPDDCDIDPLVKVDDWIALPPVKQLFLDRKDLEWQINASCSEDEQTRKFAAGLLIEHLNTSADDAETLALLAKMTRTPAEKRKIFTDLQTKLGKKRSKQL